MKFVDAITEKFLHDLNIRPAAAGRGDCGNFGAIVKEFLFSSKFGFKNSELKPNGMKFFSHTLEFQKIIHCCYFIFFWGQFLRRSVDGKLD